MGGVFVLAPVAGGDFAGGGVFPLDLPTPERVVTREGVDVGDGAGVDFLPGAATWVGGISSDSEEPDDASYSE